jgi:hypothetical protein
MSTRELHARAMELLEASMLARRAEDEAGMTGLLNEAIKLECAAADTRAEDYTLEPTRSLLHRSAAAMALSNLDTHTARRYVDAAFKSKPPGEIATELENLLERIRIMEAETKSYALKAPTGLTPVQQVIRRYTKNPPTDINGLASALGLSVIFSDLGEDAGKITRDIRRGGFSGFSIFVNENDTHTRQRFTVAHEIAHFLRHRDRVENTLIDDSMYRSRLGTIVENEANSLAADLLMPRRVVGRLRSSGITNVRKLAATFDVSIEAMERRLGLAV